MTENTLKSSPNFSVLKTLIIDDSRIFRNTLEKSLAQISTTEVIGSVWSGEKALLLIEDTPPDLIILDADMPGLNGIEILKKINLLRNLEKITKPICIIYLVPASDINQAQSTLQALEEGAFDYIHKPQQVSEKHAIEILRDQLREKIYLYTQKEHSPDVRQRALRTIETSKKLKTDALLPYHCQFKAIIIGASTGGPKALHDMLPELCEKTDLPIFIVQHMPASFTLSLATNLNKYCRHTVMEAQINATVSNNYVYIAPGGKHLTVKKMDDQIVTVLNERPPVNGCRPSVDTLFSSAADVYNGNVIAIILTGMGNDGAVGISTLKEHGGYTIAQDEESSVVWGMPGSAVATGHIDDIKPLTEIPRKISQLLRQRSEVVTDLPEKAFSFLQRYIHEKCGIKINSDKNYLFQHRLFPVLQEEGFENFIDFTLHLRRNKASDELQMKIINAIIINETSFFRDIYPFELFKELICPKILDYCRTPAVSICPATSPKRIWCVASSTGQEAYSLAMLIDEFFEEKMLDATKKKDLQILATDISVANLERAVKGEYNDFEISRGLSAERRSRYFKKDGNSWQVTDRIQNSVEFKALNLTKPFADKLGKFDVIVCRNVLIYFDNETRERIFKQFHSMLKNDGFLLLGSTENILTQSHIFKSNRQNKATFFTKNH
nr:chemotaxis-specific protein-glutamate methyltransferase CheB [Desulfobulbaceae bacterium]